MSPRSRSLRWRAGVAVAVAAGLTLSWPAGAQAQQPGGSAGVAAPRGAQPFTVTLVTGDKVTVTPAGTGRYAVRVARAKGRERVPFTTRHTRAGLSVTPADAVPLLAT